MNAQLGYSGNQETVFIKFMVLTWYLQHIFTKALFLGTENTEILKMSIMLKENILSQTA